MKKLLLIVLLFTVFSCSKKKQEVKKQEEDKTVLQENLSFSSAEQEYIKKLQEKGFVSIGIEKELGIYQPGKDGSISGFDYSLALYFCNILKIKPRFAVIGFEEVFSVNGKIPSRIKTDPNYSYEPDIYKKVDWVASTITKIPWREKIMDFVITIPTSVNLVGRKGKEIKKISELKGKVIALVKNSSYELLMQGFEEQQKLNIHYVYVKTGKEGSQKVLEGKVDFTLQDSNLLLLQIKENKNLNIMMPVSPVQFLGWGVSKKNPLLSSILRKLVHYARKNGTMDKLFSKVYNISLNEYLRIIGYKENK